MESILKKYGVYMLLGLILLFEILILIFKRKPKTLDEFLSILHEVVANRLPILINSAESQVSASIKKLNVVDAAYAIVKSQLGRELSSKEKAVFQSYVSESIEMILSTPQKKGA